jgi:hypothetical protein
MAPTIDLDRSRRDPPGARKGFGVVGVFLNLQVVVIEGKRGFLLASCEPRE